MGQGVKKLENIKHIVCVASGKGGVGKSTTAANLALALSAQGLAVGLLDADIYGPSLPLVMGIAAGTRPEIRDKRLMVPLRAHGIECNSMGFLVDERTAMVWRAPMVVSAFTQILTDTAWSALDYLIIDMPPGTGDIQLSLAQTVAVRGAVIVTTPQDIALSDARKGIEMFKKVGVPVLGVVENMSVHICNNCGHAEAIFGSGGGDRLAQDYGVEVIGRLPLDINIREQTDLGVPVVASSQHPNLKEAYAELARGVHAQALAQEARANAAPMISVADD
ncbi:MAG: iron-sulfur cluster carrier protein ApbC [Pseudomonadales bacterium]|jgi:ATP-binding protein involved in chromosome partitioning|nr:iron-sulfur cluster carrier protein ApbC [Pseudomonadales bacterium]